ncbi:hypothetical protein IFM58399_01618 [Aspergillus lentulus]|uniref:Uncharacterized protein n=1 Tax=Aspergillus lentulus TaxID=293939 RepID=A0ABQ0ZWE4_ASPLE|nr:uncharacterized protein IFM58399_01618 [Aspergillus lentulus]GFF27149.1 hypothetical protein IFM58399_01618 [Aspergillus lentulus]GFF46824.1 hypothetical protein IFM62136_00603 [Aspergillus lentulus]GFF66656.1 hypothetical protein IFM60648_01994 [Aspergillus lentulus]GFF84624.1 hypothetical protein IFM47457_06543 [Aspergillus lentulus]GFG14985.1 hypothetical protein IFM61392_08740 [Aspergillus lentulus]
MYPNLSLTTSFPSPSPNNRLPTSTTTSPASSASPSASSPFSFRLFHPHHRGASPSSTGSISANRSRSTSPLRLSALFLRRRPSKVDLALSAERTRCDGDAIERQGLDLMEPRPVDPVDYRLPMDGSIFGSSTFPQGFEAVRGRSSLQSQLHNHPFDSQRGVGFVRPRFVMGGIFEVMEGRD